VGVVTGGLVGGGVVGGGDVWGGAVTGGLVAGVRPGTSRAAFVLGVDALRRRAVVVAVVAGGAVGAGGATTGAGATTGGAVVVVVVVLDVVVVVELTTLSARTSLASVRSAAPIFQTTTTTSATAVSSSRPFSKRSSGVMRCRRRISRLIARNLSHLPLAGWSRFPGADLGASCSISVDLINGPSLVRGCPQDRTEFTLPSTVIYATPTPRANCGHKTAECAGSATRSEPLSKVANRPNGRACVGRGLVPPPRSAGDIVGLLLAGRTAAAYWRSFTKITSLRARS
jgi:hypothetical protein